MVEIIPLFTEILVIILSIFSYQFFWNNRTLTNKNVENRNSLIIFLVSCISIMIVMHFPFSFFPGDIYDLRKVPLLIGMLYGGYIVGAALTAVLIFYRFTLGVDFGAINSLILYSVILLVTFYFLSKYESYSMYKKIGCASMIAGIASLAGPIFDLFQGVHVGYIDFAFYVIYALINGLVMAFTVYLIENMRAYNRLIQEIAQKEKLDVLGQLTASVAHEIRNPLTASSGFVQLAREKVYDEKVKYYLNMALSEMNRSLEIINDYLSFAKPEYEQKSIVNLRDHINMTSSVIQPYAHLHNVSLNIELSSNIFIECYPKKLTQCLVNIMKNGIEAMPNGGEIAISTQRIKNYAVITISDSGKGMTPEQIKRLGTPFYSTKEEGTGLGLMASYNIIDMLNGKIDVESVKDKGTKFSIYIPEANIS